MEQTKFNGRTLVFMLFILCCLAGCKTTRKAETSKFPESTRYLSSKVRRDPSHRHEFPQPESSEKSSGIRICGNDPFQYQSGF